MKEHIYLDNQASTPVDIRVKEAMLPFFDKEYGNPHANDHFFGWNANKAVEKARQQIAQFINADANEIIFTSGATESNNLAIFGNVPFLKKSKRKKILISAFEHKCVLESAKAASNQNGLEVEYIQPTSEGFITPEALLEKMDDTVGLVSILTVNNEIGTIQPIKELCTIAHRYGALFHTDAAQAGIFLDINILDSGVDLLSLSGHKICCPKGIGCLFTARSIQNEMTALLFGGGQEGGLRSGTLPVMLCAGLGKACSIAVSERMKSKIILQKNAELFLSQLREKIPNIFLNGSQTHRHPGNLNIRFPGVDAHSLLQALQPRIAASSGSACSTGTLEPSYVLRAIGLTETEASESIRFSFGPQNTKADAVTAADIIYDTIQKII